MERIIWPAINEWALGMMEFSVGNRVVFTGCMAHARSCPNVFAAWSMHSVSLVGGTGLAIICNRMAGFGHTINDNIENTVQPIR